VVIAATRSRYRTFSVSTPSPGPVFGNVTRAATWESIDLVLDLRLPGSL
jgi:hypothetical protein